MYLAFTRTPGESYCRRLESSLLCLRCIFRVLINFLVCWFRASTLGLVLLQIFAFSDVVFIFLSPGLSAGSCSICFVHCSTVGRPIWSFSPLFWPTLLFQKSLHQMELNTLYILYAYTQDLQLTSCWWPNAVVDANSPTHTAHVYVGVHVWVVQE